MISGSPATSWRPPRATPDFAAGNARIRARALSRAGIRAECGANSNRLNKRSGNPLALLEAGEAKAGPKGSTCRGSKDIDSER